MHVLRLCSELSHYVHLSGEVPRNTHTHTKLHSSESHPPWASFKCGNHWLYHRADPVYPWNTRHGPDGYGGYLSLNRSLVLHSPQILPLRGRVSLKLNTKWEQPQSSGHCQVRWCRILPEPLALLSRLYCRQLWGGGLGSQLIGENVKLHRLLFSYRWLHSQEQRTWFYGSIKAMSIYCWVCSLWSQGSHSAGAVIQGCPTTA